MIIYYNPDCSKCREARELLEGENCKVEIRNYLEIPPTKKEIEKLIALLGCKAGELVRKTEPFFIENFSDRKFEETDYVDLLVLHPELLQRPIVIDGEKAIIGRPPGLVLNLLERH